MSSLEEKATNYRTLKHIMRVRDLINQAVVELLKRGEIHDQSKLEDPELKALTNAQCQLADLTYGSPEYEAQKRGSPDMVVYLKHHYANNRHHPEHHKDGVNDMTLVDLLEMLLDWKASSEQHNDGNIRKSIEINGHRFGMSPQLVRIFENTVKQMRLE